MTWTVPILPSRWVKQCATIVEVVESMTADEWERREEMYVGEWATDEVLRIWRRLSGRRAG